MTRLPTEKCMLLLIVITSQLEHMSFWECFGSRIQSMHRKCTMCLKKKFLKIINCWNKYYHLLNIFQGWIFVQGFFTYKDDEMVMFNLFLVVFLHVNLPLFIVARRLFSVVSKLPGQGSKLSDVLGVKNRSKAPQMLPSAFSLLSEASFVTGLMTYKIIEKFIKHTKRARFICGLIRVLSFVLKHIEIKY